MPCRSYEDDYRTGSPTESWQYKELKENNDKLARIACQAMDALRTSDDPGLYQELMKNKEIGDWYTAHRKADEKSRKDSEAKLAKENLRKQAVSKLTPEELAAFGLDKKGLRK